MPLLVDLFLAGENTVSVVGAPLVKLLPFWKDFDLVVEEGVEGEEELEDKFKFRSPPIVNLTG